MPAKSKAQQKFMGMVRAAQTGDKPASAKVAKVAKSMKKSDVKDFASTKHKGKPEKVKKEDVKLSEKMNLKTVLSKLQIPKAAIANNQKLISYIQRNPFIVTQLLRLATEDTKLKEDVKIPIKIGDTILMGRFKNKRVVVKSIDWNEKGDLLINGRSAAKFRITKESKESKMPMLKDLIKETAKGKFGSIYDMKAQMKDGTFDPDNPEVLIHGWGRLPLKSVHKWIAKDLKKIASDVAVVSDRTAKNTEILLYKNHSPLEAKIKALNEVYQQMNTSQYKRAVTMYKRKKR